MANRRPQSGRRMDFGRNDRPKNFGRSGGLNPWQATGPTTGLPNLLPLSAGPTEATLALASNIINLLQPRQNPVPSLLDMPIRRDFGPDMARFDRGVYGSNRMGNQGNFRRSGNYVRPSDRMNRKPYRPSDGQRQNNKGSQKKDADSKAKPKESEQEKKDNTNEEKKEGEGTENADKKEESKEQPKTRYDNIDSAFLKCHVCNKSMWDGRSFENHLSGRAHAIMMQKTAESYALTSDTMRQEFKIREMKRTRKIGSHQPRDFYCAMCDMYASDGAVHRTTVGHRKLKKYLHPTCTCCHKEMPTRIELDEHRLSAEHLRTIQDKQEVVFKPKPEVMVISNLTVEQSYLREGGGQQPRRFKSHGDRDAAENGVRDDSEQCDENKEDAGDTESVKPMEVDPDTDNTILDYKEGDDLANATSDMIPSYNTERGVGASFLDEFKCYQCKLCRKLLDNAETAEVHLRTWRHHQLFARLLSDKIPSQAQAQEAESQESNEAGKRPSESQEDGNWKRRRTDDADSKEVAHDEDSTRVVKGAEKEEEKNDAELNKQEVTVADDSMDDWDRTIDEIIEDEKKDDDDDDVQIKEPEAEVVIVKDELDTPPKVVATPARPQTNQSARGQPTPRGRGRGRPRRC